MRRFNCLFLFFLLPLFLFSQLQVAGIFGDNAVIQQEYATPIWGRTKADSLVELNFAGKTYRSVADSIGKWLIKLTPMKADGKTHKLIVESCGEKIEFKNILIGEVWFASGQSNMEWKVGNEIFNRDEEIANANYPEIRFNTIKVSSSIKPESDIPSKKWEVCTPSSVKGFSAVSYFFARELHLDKKVPVGIIVAARGATNIETWISREKLMSHHEFADKLSKIDSLYWKDKIQQVIQAEKEREDIAKNSLVGINMKVHTGQFDDSDWNRTLFPLNMPKMNYLRFWGIVWVRKSFKMSFDAINQEWKLTLPIKCQNDRVYVNGNEIIRDVSKLKDMTFLIPKGILHKGNNIIAIRMYVNWGIGEIGDENKGCYLESNNNQRVNLDGYWLHNNKIEPAVAQWLDYYNTCTVSFNSMINPVIPYGIRGFLWYQGENNANSTLYKQYVDLQPMLIADWRKRWQQGDLPFLFVQLSAYGERSLFPKSVDSWANFRDSQTTTLYKSNNTAMACTIDIGEANNIHPKNKQEVGRRLYIAAKAKAYGSAAIYSGPMIRSAKLDEDTIKVSFYFSENGLKTANNDLLKGFAVADASGKWVWAEARIVGNYVYVNSKKVKKPTQIQYAWQGNPECNLYNTEGLPAVPFKMYILE